MPVHALRRDPWTGRPQQLGDLFLMRKGELQARCEVWTHPRGWECRLFAGDDDHIITLACGDEEQVFAFSEQWTAALAAKGWAAR